MTISQTHSLQHVIYVYIQYVCEYPTVMLNVLYKYKNFFIFNVVHVLFDDPTEGHGSKCFSLKVRVCNCC